MAYSLTDGAAFANKIKRTVDEIFADTNLVYIKAYIDGKEVLTNSNFVVHLHQQIGEHDTFEIECSSTAFEAFGAYPFSQSRDFLGKKITLEYKQFGQVAYLYTGVVTGLTNKKLGGYEGKMVLTGHSPTILLDNGADCQSYEKKKLSDIVQISTEEYPSDLVKMIVTPQSKVQLPYTVQYQETDFNFIRRLAKRYGEWFYYDGQQIIFGEHHVGLTELVEREDLITYELKMSLLPQKFSYVSYDANTTEDYTVNSESISRIDTNNPFQKYALGASEQLFQKNATTLFNSNLLIRGRPEVKEAVERTKERNRNVFYVEGKSRNPNMKVGIIVRLKAYMPNNTVFANGEVPLESYRVIELTHFHDGFQGYYNTFVGVPLDIKVPPYADEMALPFCEEQSATVMDNNDPDGMSRIRVQFPWQKIMGGLSPWLRVTTPYAGKGKGMHILPEVGEEVIVTFENGNAEKPIVLGAMFNSAGTSGHGGSGNYMKGLSTAAGSNLTFNDQAGSMNLADQGGASMNFDGSGNATTNANQTHAVNAGSAANTSVGEEASTLKMDAAGNITLEGNTNITLKVGENTVVIDQNGITMTNKDGNSTAITPEGVVNTATIGDIGLEAVSGKLSATSSAEMELSTDADLSITGGPSASISSGDTNIM